MTEPTIEQRLEEIERKQLALGEMLREIHAEIKGARKTLDKLAARLSEDEDSRVLREGFEAALDAMP
jgi:septation ring formation regulator EzrA